MPPDARESVGNRGMEGDEMKQYSSIERAEINLESDFEHHEVRSPYPE